MLAYNLKPITLSGVPIGQLLGTMLTPIEAVSLLPKVMKVKGRSVDFTTGKHGILKQVMAKRFVKNQYTHIQINGTIHNVQITKGLYMPIVWINQPINQ